MSEFRNAFRYRTERPAVILLKDGGSIKCTVRNISTQGARLEFDGAPHIPENFFLLIHGQSERHHCHLVWQKDSAAGVQYI